MVYSWHNQDWGYLTRRRRYYPRAYRNYNWNSYWYDPWYFYYNHPASRYKRYARWYGVTPRAYDHYWWW